MGVSNAIEGGYDTARLTAAEHDRAAREEREAAARRYLTRRGLDDVAEILGLVEPATPKRKRSVKGLCVVMAALVAAAGEVAGLALIAALVAGLYLAGVR